MLNIGVVRDPDYYLQQVAPDRAAYYVGSGEAPGRWTGALAGILGLAGEVDPAAFRHLLAGRHPDGSHRLLARRRPPVGGPLPPEPMLDPATAAAALGISTRTLRRWTAAGTRHWLRAQAATSGRGLTSTAEVRRRLAEMGAADGTGDPDLNRCILRPPAGPGRTAPRGSVPTEEVERLRRPSAPTHRQGFDLVFRPAKGYSVLWAVGPPELTRALWDIHHRAVDDALRYLEASACVARTTVSWRGKRVRARARGDGFAVACFDHRESRAGDPLIHTHCLVANVTRLPGGRFAALEPTTLFRQAMAADAIYQATFRHLAERRLGLVSGERPAAFPNPVGVPEAVLDHFSRRSSEIAAEVERLGSASSAARQLAALSTRRAKERSAATSGLHERWRSAAGELGFDGEAVAACLGRFEGRTVPDEELNATAAQLAGAEGLTANASTFGRAEVIRALAAALGGSMPGRELVHLADRFLADDAAVQVREHRSGRPRGRIVIGDEVVDDLSAVRFTVPELVETEAALMSVADARSGPSIGPDTVAAALGAHPRLSAAQQGAVRAVCAADALLRPVVGFPGAGKTAATAGMVTAFRAAGHPVIGCAVTANAAAELANASGLQVSDTLARVLLDLDAPGGGLRPGTVVVADEASMLPLRGLHRLLAHIEAADGTVILVGDPFQHGAVGPGAFFAWLVRQRRNVPRLTENHRQAGTPEQLAAERRAQASLRAGRVEDAIQFRREQGQLTTAESIPGLVAAMVADWHRDWDTTGDSMIAASNVMRSRLNAAARSLLGDAGRLHGPAIRTASGLEFRLGDAVVARRNWRRLRSPIDSSWWVRNGARGEILDVNTETGDVLVAFLSANRDGDRHRVRLPGAYVAEHLEHAYALTDYGVQGASLTRSRAVLEEASTLPGTYVANTRGRVENHLYGIEGEVVDAGCDVEVSHGRPYTQSADLAVLAERISRRRPDGLLHERDPHLSEASALARTHTTEDLVALAVAAIQARTPAAAVRDALAMRKTKDRLAQADGRSEPPDRG